MAQRKRRSFCIMTLQEACHFHHFILTRNMQQYLLAMQIKEPNQSTASESYFA